MAINLEPGTRYAHLDDALLAASCLCGLAATGATIYGTTEPMHADPKSGESYLVAVDCTRHDGSTWTAPIRPYEPIYTITHHGRHGENE